MREKMWQKEKMAGSYIWRRQQALEAAGCDYQGTVGFRSKPKA
jgi:hypothetical protein